MMTLDCLLCGKTATVARIGADLLLRRRLMELGVVPGAKIQTIHIAPLGDPILFWVAGYRLAIRRSDAAHIAVYPEVEE